MNSEHFSRITFFESVIKVDTSALVLTCRYASQRDKRASMFSFSASVSYSISAMTFAAAGETVRAASPAPGLAFTQ